jgi:uncharacterized protein (TIGR02611 family)
MSRTEAPSVNGFVERLKAVRARVRRTRAGFILWRGAVVVVGVTVIVVGIVLLPLPGPGWLIIFAGLGILATEFEWARRLLRFARDQVSRWTTWAARQNRFVQVLLGIASVVFLAAVAWGAYLIYAG